MLSNPCLSGIRLDGRSSECVRSGHRSDLTAKSPNLTATKFYSVHDLEQGTG